jgi:signal transduction histidine kinase
MPTASDTFPASADARTEELRQPVRSEQLRLIFAHMVFATPVGLAFTFVLAAYLYREISLAAIWTWVAGRVVIAVPRVVQARRFRSVGEPYSQAQERLALALISVDGLWWGLAGAWIANGPADVVSIVIAALASVACVAAFGLQVRLAATALYVVPLLLLPSCALLVRGDGLGVFAGTGLLCLLALLLASGRSAEHRLAEVFRLRHLMARRSEQRGEALRLAELKLERIEEEKALQQRKARVDAQQEVLRARSIFLAKISHELRSPLQGIVSAIDVFERRHGHRITQDDELIARIRRASALLNTQLRDLLTLARGEAGHLELHREPFDACAMVEGVVAAVRDAANVKGVLLSYKVPQQPVFVFADANRLDQVLTNLLTNSVRYTAQGSVEIELRPFDPASGQLAISISDTGSGIPDAMIPHLFALDKPLPELERRTEGSGIGLAIVGTLLELMGGKVAVHSEEGQGTRFHISVPVDVIDAEVEQRRLGADARRASGPNGNESDRD